MARKLTAEDLERFERILLHARSVFTGATSHLEKAALGPADPEGGDHGRDVAGDPHSQEFSLELLERHGSTLREIDEALARIEDGSYGRCEACESWIRKVRLQAMPHTRLCIDCQREAEQEAS